MQIKIQYLILSILVIINQLNLFIHCDTFRIGALFTEEEIEERVALEQAIIRLNSFNGSRSLKNIEIQPIIKTIQHTDILDIKEKTCDLLRMGVGAIVGPLQVRPATLVQTIADKFEIPHILLRNDFIFTREKISINMYPNAFSLMRAIIELVKNLQWQDFAIVYENNEGALFTEEEIEERVALEQAIIRLNSFNGSRSLKNIEIQPIIKTIQHTDILDIKEKTCDLLRMGVGAIVGPLQVRPATLVQTIADKFEIPHILLRNDFIFTREKISINMYPNAFSLMRAIIELVKNLQWQDFAIVYENNEDAIYANEFLKAAREEVRYNDLKDGKLKVKPRNWNVQILQFKPNSEYSETFWTLIKYDISNFVIIVKVENLYRIMNWAQKTGMISHKFNFVIANLDMHSIRFDDFMHAKSNIHYFKVTNELNKDLVKQHYWRCSMKRCPNVPFDDQYLSTTAALIYDGVHVVAAALKEAKMTSKFIETEKLECGRDKTWTYGSTFINLMRSVLIRGQTGHIEFDQTTYRTKVEFSLMRLEQQGLERVGQYTGDYFIREKSLTLPQVASGPMLSGQILKIVTAFNDPYTRLKSSAMELIGNDRYEGYVVDLISELSKVLNFEYELLIFPTKQYDGMLGNVTRGEVDLAVVDLTITAERQSIVDFSLPFMDTGIGVLYYKITKEKISLFSFMNPFSLSVWFCLILLTSLAALCLHIMGRISPYEWFNPYPCKQDDDILENPYNFKNSIWYINGALLQQGSEFAPRSSSTRWTAGVWYFVTLILVSSYTANLAAFLTVVNYEYPFNEAVELLNHPEIKFGCKVNGSTCGFFKYSNISDYRKLWDRMETIISNEVGRSRVESDAGAFAYFQESKAIEYDMERFCSVTQRGGLLDSKGYGIAVNQNNKTLKRQLDEGILQLQEGGVLHVLYDRWWKQKGGGVCFASGTGEATQLNIDNVGGVFVVLIIGMIFSVIASIIEVLYTTYKSPALTDRSFKENIIRELKFAFDIQVPKKINPKPESIRNQSIPNQSMQNQSIHSQASKVTEPKRNLQ